MSPASRLALRRARRTGLLVCVATVAVAVAFIAGVARESYWALAVPVAVATLGALALLFSIGHTIRTVRGIPPEAEHYEGRAARRIALGICAASVAAGAAFLYGVAQQSYWALALPVGAAVLGLAGMVFWIGWAIVTQRTTLPAAEPDPAPPPGVEGEPGTAGAAERP